ncbi:MAG: DUF4199 domain-containing protein [Bacteroidia bacterium]|nr:DUF4199 domain-containing protein [Bacteroidia bacterium]
MEEPTTEIPQEKLIRTDVVLRFGLLLAIFSVSYHLIAFFTGWVYQVFSGPILFVLAIFSHIGICFVMIWREIKRSLNGLAFGTIFLYCVSASIAGGIVASAYDIIFYQFQPDFDIQVVQAMKINANQIFEDAKKGEGVDVKELEKVQKARMEDFERMKKDILEHPPTMGQRVVSRISMFTLFGGITGLILGILLRRSLPKANRPSPKS